MFCLLYYHKGVVFDGDGGAARVGSVKGFDLFTARCCGENVKRRVADAVRHVGVAASEIALIQVIGVTVRDKKRADGRKIHAEFQRMHIGVGGEVDEQRVVKERLAARFDLSALFLPCRRADGAVAEKRRNALGGCRSEILQFHFRCPLYRMSFMVSTYRSAILRMLSLSAASLSSATPTTVKPAFFAAVSAKRLSSAKTHAAGVAPIFSQTR